MVTPSTTDRFGPMDSATTSWPKSAYPAWIWQVEEKELLAREDYERIVALGWPEFFDLFMKERILDDVPAERLPPS